MDARITKQRLGNLLSYDWIKILVAIAAAIFALSVVFMTTRVQPAEGQRFTVHYYGGLNQGGDSSRFTDAIGNGVFSYDILQTGTEYISDDYNGDQVFSVRRAVKEGTVAIAADYTSSEEEGALTPYARLCEMGVGGSMGIFLDVEEYFKELDGYLSRFFGEDYGTGEADTEAIRAYFLEKNGGDRRFRSDEQKEEGVRLETARLTQIRDDYLFVQKKIADGVFSVAYYEYAAEEGEEAERVAAGIRIGRLTTLGNLCNYTDAAGLSSATELVMMFYDNGAGAAPAKYEIVTLLRYLAERYA